MHCHTTASDGVLPPGALVDRAVQKGVEVLAITDHDTTAAWEPASRAAEGRLELWPGIEINCSEPGPYEVHVLGYFLQPDNPALQIELARLREARQGRIGRMVDNLTRLGVEISLEDVRRFSHGPSLGRPHLARALVERGVVPDVNAAFDRYLAVGQPAYEPRYSLRPRQAIRVILEAGGVPVLAHPGLIGTEDFLEGYVEEGLRGLEVYYPQHDADQVAHFEALARRYGLLATGGSDYHGPGRSELGHVRLPPEALAALRAAGGR